MKGKSVLITGATGFLGSYISKYFANANNRLTLVGRFSAHKEIDLNKKYGNDQVYNMTFPNDLFNAIMKNNQPDILIHCAGTASVADSMGNPYGDFLNSVAASAAVFDSARRYSPNCRLIIMSSASVYGNPQLLPITEKSSCNPVSAYGYHKVMMELLGEEFFKLYGISSVILRIFSAYGRGIRRQVVFDLFEKFIDPSLEKVEIIGTGEETRDFIHAYDIARSIECLCDNNATGVFNIASGKQIRIADLANMIRQIVGSSKEIFYTGHTRPGDPLYWQADVEKIRKIGFEDSISLEQGLRDYYSWLQGDDERNFDDFGN